jgi:hypothetical protein
VTELESSAEKPIGNKRLPIRASGKVTDERLITSSPSPDLTRISTLSRT